MIDLHIHTIATPHHSYWTANELIAAAKSAQLAMIAITDHNTTTQVSAIQKAAEGSGIHVISGVEIDTSFEGKLWHTLLYNAPPEHPEVTRLCNEVVERNRSDAQRLAQSMRKQGQELPFLDAIESNRTANLADVAHALVKAGIWPQEEGVDDESAGMAHLLRYHPAAYQPLSVTDVIDVARTTGGTAILAHPGREKSIYAIPATAHDIAQLVAAGIHGLEVFYPTHTADQTTFYLEQVRHYNLLASAGSDSHGPKDPLRQRTSHSEPDLIEKLVNHFVN